MALEYVIVVKSLFAEGLSSRLRSSLTDARRETHPSITLRCHHGDLAVHPSFQVASRVPLMPAELVRRICEKTRSDKDKWGLCCQCGHVICRECALQDSNPVEFAICSRCYGEDIGEDWDWDSWEGEQEDFDEDFDEDVDGDRDHERGDVFGE